MTAKYIQDGKAIEITAAGAIEAGDVVVLGELVGVANFPITSGGIGAVAIEGVFEMPKDYGDSGKALTAGQEVYWDSVNSCIKAAVAQVVAEGAVTTEASAVHGFAVAAAATTDQTVLVSINA